MPASCNDRTSRHSTLDSQSFFFSLDPLIPQFHIVFLEFGFGERSCRVDASLQMRLAVRTVTESMGIYRVESTTPIRVECRKLIGLWIPRPNSRKTWF